MQEMNGRERVLAMIEGREVDHLPLMPITMMFAADRLGVKYRNYVTDYHTLVEAQIKTANEFGIDHVSAISDPTREAHDLGAPIEWFEDQPPAFAEVRALLADKSVLHAVRLPDPSKEGRMLDRVRAVALLKERVSKEKLIEGWIEGPCGSGANLRGINRLMLDFYDDPGFVRDLFGFCVETGLRFGGAQLEAGADIIGIGDPAASLVGPKLYDEFVWPYERQLVDGLHAIGGRVRLHICGNTRRILAGMGRVGAEIVDLDWISPLSEGREQMGEAQVLLGNLDPVSALRNGSPDSITSAIAECHRQAGARYVVGAGCEVVRDTPLDNLRALGDYARSHRP
jgi:MtaA/CmuA family methyltransferase